MGQVKHIHYETLIDPIPDRYANRVRVHEDAAGEFTIHFRNLKIVLHTPEEIEEWRNGFKIALEKYEASMC